MRFLGKAIGYIIMIAAAILIIALCVALVVAALAGLGQLFGLLGLIF